MSEAKEVTGGDNRKTKAECYVEMRAAAQPEFDAGCDLPTVTPDVDFVNCADTEEYKQFTALQNIYLGDMVRVITKRTGVSVSLRMTEYTYDCLTRKYTQISNANIQDATIAYAKIADAAINALKADSIAAVIAKVQTLTAFNILTDELGAQLVRTAVLSAGVGTFDEATVRHLIASALNVTDATADKVFISNLALDYANIVQANVSSLCVKAADGNYYKLNVDCFGNVTAEQTGLTQEEKDACVTSIGKTIIDTEIAASDLSASNLKAIYALINRLDAARIDVDSLTARTAFVNFLRTTDISSNSYIRLALDNLEGEIQDVDGWVDGLKRWVTFDESGLTQGKSGSIYSTQITEDGFKVKSSRQATAIATMDIDGVRVEKERIGDIVCKATTTGGWVWQEA